MTTQAERRGLVAPAKGIDRGMGMSPAAERSVIGYPTNARAGFDVYFSADVETDGPIPGPYSMLSFGLVYAGAYDGTTFYRPPSYDRTFYIELRPISSRFEQEALDVNGLDRDHLILEGEDPRTAMSRAADWVREHAGIGSPVIVAYAA